MLLYINCKGCVVRTGVQVTPEKRKSHLNSQFPPEMAILKSHWNFQSQLKSNFLFTSLPSQIYAWKCFQHDCSQVNNMQTLPIGIYWHQSNSRRLIHSHLFVRAHKGGLTIGLMLKLPWWWVWINKLESCI